MKRIIFTLFFAVLALIFLAFIGVAAFTVFFDPKTPQTQHEEILALPKAS